MTLIALTECSRMLAIDGKYEFILVLADLLPELLFDQRFEVGLIINYKDLRHQWIALSFSLSAAKSTGFVRKSSAPSRIAVL